MGATNRDYLPNLRAPIDTLFSGWEWRAAYDDAAFGIKHWNDIERVALIGDARWQARLRQKSPIAWGWIQE